MLIRDGLVSTNLFMYIYLLDYSCPWSVISCARSAGQSCTERNLIQCDYDGECRLTQEIISR